MNRASLVTSYAAMYLDVGAVENGGEPDMYIIKQGQRIKKPKPSFVISRNSEGKVISKYEDNSWDLKPYRQGGNQSLGILHFGNLPENCIEDAKWLMFVLMFMISSGKATQLSVSTLYDYMKPIRSLSKFAENKEISINDILTDERYLLAYAGSLTKRSPLQNFMNFTNNIYSVGSFRSGINVININQISEVGKRLKELGEEEQTPVIPPRIYSEFIKQLTEFIELVSDSSSQIRDLLNESLRSEHVVSDPKSTTVNHKKLPLQQLVKRHGLCGLFSELGVETYPNLSLFLSRVQHACRLMILTYTGMRSAESYSLMVGALEEEVLHGTKIFRLRAKTTKFSGQERQTLWITSEHAKNAINLAEMIAVVIGSYIQLKESETQLFISAGYLGFNGDGKVDGYTRVTKTANKDQEVYHYFDEGQFKIQKCDLDHLKAVNEFRDWENEDGFCLNSIWRFKAHQLRRSLAFYVCQSGLVGLPSLQRQLKHISREMTIYYSQSTNTNGLFKNDFIKLLKTTKPEADTVSFISDVVKSDESLWGAHGRFIDKHMNLKGRVQLIKEDRKSVLKQFKNGEIALSVTSLGVCTKVGPCDQKAMREISSCLSCEKAIIKKSKLDYVIKKQSELVQGIEGLDEHEFEYKGEVNELIKLQRYREKISIQEGDV